MSDVYLGRNKQHEETILLLEAAVLGVDLPKPRGFVHMYVLAQSASHHAHVNSNLLMQVFTENPKTCNGSFSGGSWSVL